MIDYHHLHQVPGPKNSIVLVDILGHIIAVGLSPQQMTVLAAISDREALEKLKNIQTREQMAPALADHLLQYKEVLQSVVKLGRSKKRR
jgi:flagellar biogenesis protein FliO